MTGKSRINGRIRKAEDLEIRFTVAECGEIHSLGEYHENIRTVEEAAAIYRNIPPERMHAVPSIGIKLHRKGRPAYEDVQMDILSGGEINTGLLRYAPEAGNNPMVWRAAEELKKLFPEKEVVDY